MVMQYALGLGVLLNEDLSSQFPESINGARYMGLRVAGRFASRALVTEPCGYPEPWVHILIQVVAPNG